MLHFKSKMRCEKPLSSLHIVDFRKGEVCVGTCTAGQQWTELCRTRTELQRRLKIKPIIHEWESQIGKKRHNFFGSDRSSRNANLCSFVRVKIVLSSQSSSFGLKLKLSTLVYFILRRTVGAENPSSCFQKSEWEYFWMLNRQLWHNPKIRRQEYYQVTTVKNGFIIGYWVQSIGTNVTNEKLSSQICFPFVVWQNIQRHYFN